MRVRWLPLTAAPILAGLTLLTGDQWLLLLAAAIVGVGAVALILRPRLDALGVDVRLPARVQVGQQVPCTIEIHNPGGRASPLTRIAHRIDGLDDVAVLAEPLLPGQSAQVTVDRFAVARGAATDSLILLTSAAPLGLVVARRAIRVPGTLFVHPPVTDIPCPAEPFSSTEEGAGRSRVDRAGLDVHGIREWVPGDSARQVHWRSTARRGRLVVLERESVIAPGVAVLVVGPGGGPRWEALVCLVASTALAAVRSGHPVSLVTGQAGLADLIDGGSTEILDWCAMLGEPRWLEAPTVSRAVAAAGRRGLLLVGTDQPPGPWWTILQAEASRADIRLALLQPPPADLRGTGHV